jgi:NAD(P)-dependent dehydrogenase (short-subunit alcohol dehydrogenase family)
MPLSTIADTDDATFERLVDVNLKGTFNTLREAARRPPLQSRLKTPYPDTSRDRGCSNL